MSEIFGCRLQEDDLEEIKRNVDALLESIKNSEEYQEYKRQEKLLDNDPELKERVFQFRGSNFKMQNEADKDELLHVVDRLAAESAQLRRNPQVNAYLDAELAICRLMQDIVRKLTDGVDIQVPEL